MDDYDYNFTNDIQSELPDYFRDNSITSDDEENQDDEINCIDDDDSTLDEEPEPDETDVDVSVPDPDYLGFIMSELQCDFKNSVLNDFYTTQLNLSAKEMDILEKCQNPQLKRLLLLNRLKALQCLEHTKKVQQAEKFCDEIVMNLSRKNPEKVAKKVSYTIFDSFTGNVFRLGFPYFKLNRKRITPKYNADYHKKVANYEWMNTSFRDGRRWIHKDQIALYKTICNNYYNYRKEKLQQQLISTKSTYKVNPIPTIRIEIKKLNKQLKAIEKETEHVAPPLDDESGINWLSIINELYDRHSISECKSFWHIYLHPHINKNNWSPEENSNIHSLVLKYNFQNWDAIARELGTNRTGFLVIVHYFTKLCDKFRRNRFSPEEDIEILNLVEKQRFGARIPWADIANHFVGRSKYQLYHRYKYYLVPQNIKKGSFTEAEDILLCLLVDKFGNDYSTIAKIMKTRTCGQLKSRYRNYIENITYNLLPYTIEDDREIIHHVEQNGETNWRALGNQVKKSWSNVKDRYKMVKKYLEKNVKIEDIPRSKNNYFYRVQSERSEILKKVLKEIRKNIDGIPTLETVERYLERYRLENEQIQVCKTFKVYEPSAADQQLIEFFKKRNQDQNQEVIKPCEAVCTDSLHRIIKLLLLLGSSETLLLNPLTLPETSDCNLMVEIKTLYHQQYAHKVRSSSCVQFEANTIREILPPTICTVIGLKHLLVNCEEMKKNNNNNSSMVKQGSFELLASQNLTTVDEVTKNKIIEEQNLFFTRLLSVFKWPLILSLSDPSVKVTPEKKEKDEFIKVPQISRAKSRKRILDDDSDEDFIEHEEWRSSKGKKSDTLVKYYPGRVVVPKISDRQNKSARCFFFLGSCPP